MKISKMLIMSSIFIVLSFWVAGCGSADSDGDVDGDTENEVVDGDEPITDGDSESIDGDTETTDGDIENADDDEEIADVDLEDIDGDTEQVDGDSEEDSEMEDPGLPDKLNIEYTREQDGEPLTQEEIDTFTKKVVALLKKVNYFDYLLYTTHGVDSSYDEKDWQFWYNERFRKEGDTVVFYHPENLTDGGHNLHIPFSRVLGDTLAAHMLLPEDEKISLVAEKFCKGFSASMQGMVYDENDTVNHLMSRNVVPGFSQEFLTHDGKKKKVDCSGWYSDYYRWNCHRFEYKNNPYWGSIWVTNLRSKDDVPHVFRMVPVLRYALETTENQNVLSACGETLDLLEKFARDIVDHEYVIRTKYTEGEIYLPGYEGDPYMEEHPDEERQPGDLSSFSYWDLPDNGMYAQCNAKGGADFIGYHKAISDCGRGEPNWYDSLAINANNYNRRIVRYFHLANLANALVHNDNEVAALLMDGFDERMESEKNTKEEDRGYSYHDWMRNLALYYAQSASMGFPITNSEARQIQEYYLKAVDYYKTWGYWDLWDDSVPDGASGGYRPANCVGSGEEQDCWFRVEDLGQIFENCWSPLVNPNTPEFINCDIVKDPSKWDTSILDEVE